MGFRFEFGSQSAAMMRSGLLFLVLALGLALGSAIRPIWALDPDAAAYMALGRSVAAGQGYVLDGLPHAKYPPGLPMLLAAVTRLSGPEAYGAMHACLVALLLVAVVLAGLLARRLGAPPAAALAVAACTGLSQTFFQLSVEYLRSEVPFLAASLGALLALLAACSRSGRWWQVALAGALVALAMLTRLAGVALLAVPAAVLVCPRAVGSARLRSAVLILVGLAVLGGWMGRGRVIASEHPTAPDYSAELMAAQPRDLTKHVRVDMPRLSAGGFARRVAGNAEVLARACATLLTNVDRAAERLPVGLAFLALLIYGLARGVGPRSWDGDFQAAASDGGSTPPDVVARRLAALYVAGTLGLYLIWPFDQQERFYAPLLPLLLLFAGYGAALLHGHLGQLFRAGPLARGLVILGAIGTLALLASQRSAYPTLLDRWSTSYAALLGVAALGVTVLSVAAWRQLWPRLPTGSPLLVVVLFGLPFAHQRFVRWPGIVQTFEQRRRVEPRLGPLATIDVHPVLEAVAAHLATTPPDTVLMTDVPKMLTIIGERRCVPFVYGVDPPAVVTDGVDLVFHTGSQADAAAALAAVADSWPVATSIPLTDDPAGPQVDVLRAPGP